jgi:lysophospholipase L1-like esterase
MLGFALAWYAGCLAALAITGVRRWILTHAAQLGALCVSTTLGLVAVEAFCRYDVVSSRERWRELHSRMEYSPELGWKLVSGKDGVGAHGWRGPYRTAAKSSGCCRIVCVGDSTTHGSGCPWYEAWPHQLETLLNADSDWTATHGVTEVINLGVPAYGTDQELLALKKYGLSFRPDVVILHICINDFADISYDHDWRMWEGVTRYKPYYALEGAELVLKRDYAPPPRYPAGEPDNQRSLGLYPALLYKVDRFLDNRESGYLPGGKDRWPIHADFHAEYVRARPLLWALVREMARASAGASSTFLVTLSPAGLERPTAAWPWRVSSFLQEYQVDAAAAGVTAIHCMDEYFAKGGNNRFQAVADSNHLNKEGNALVARHTMAWLKSHVPAQP